MPTTRSAKSIYGLDLNIMDTPRNTTMLSQEQLQAINIQDPRSFSYLTSSSYTDSAFGGPNVPRIRGQYGDVFHNGMRSSFTNTGYGAPLSFNSIESINITKGPASVISGPGPGVGGSADFLTKKPHMQAFSGEADFSFDNLGHRLWTLDFGGPIIPGELGYRVSYGGTGSDSYFNEHFFNQHSLYVAATWTPNENYSLDFNTEGVFSNYQENVGVNRINQAFIDHGTYLRGVPYREDISTAFGGDPFPVGSPGNPFAPVPNIFTVIRLGNPIHLDDKITIDETPGTDANAFVYNAQVVQRYRFSDDTSIENNTFFNYENRDNRAQYYYADSAKDTWTIESKTQLITKFDIPIKAASGTDDGWSLGNQINIGGTIRFAHVNYIGNFNNEPVGVYDLSTDPNLWIFDPGSQVFGNAFPYKSPNGRILYGVPGRDSVNFGSTQISDLIDLGAFVEDRLEVTDKISLLFGGRFDAVQNNVKDPLGGAVFNGLAREHSTAWYGLGNVNFSPVYQFAPWGSFYLTYDYAQNVNGGAGDGGVGSYGQTPDKRFLQQTSRLYEAGLKFNLMNNTLFIGTALFHQDRLVPSGQGGASTSKAQINGFEAELNYQPERHFFATASYSYLRTRLTTPSGFYNYPAAPGDYVDGAGLFASFFKDQHFNDPGIPQHVFNFLANYRFDSGFGIRFNAQVTGPFDTTTSGYIDLDNSLFVPKSIIAAGGYYQSPRIPWQYTLNAAVFYEMDPYTFKIAIYNLTDEHNLEGSTPFYGNDFLVHSDPISAEVSVKVKF